MYMIRYVNKLLLPWLFAENTQYVFGLRQLKICGQLKFNTEHFCQMGSRKTIDTGVMRLRMISFLTRCMCEDGFFYWFGQCISAEECGCPTVVYGELRRYNVRSNSF